MRINKAASAPARKILKTIEENEIEEARLQLEKYQSQGYYTMEWSQSEQSKDYDVDTSTARLLPDKAEMEKYFDAQRSMVAEAIQDITQNPLRRRRTKERKPLVRTIVPKKKRVAREEFLEEISKCPFEAEIPLECLERDERNNPAILREFLALIRIYIRENADISIFDPFIRENPVRTRFFEAVTSKNIGKSYQAFISEMLIKILTAKYAKISGKNQQLSRNQIINHAEKLLCAIEDGSNPVYHEVSQFPMRRTPQSHFGDLSPFQ